MIDAQREVWLQITAGQGPVECTWAVIKVLEQLQSEVQAASLELKVIEIEAGPEPGTAQSALVSIHGGSGLDAFLESWSGTVQWIARSPFRPEHRRKNWFVGVDVIEPAPDASFEGKDVRWETMRSSGPGGQHVNRTESGVRITHIPTGLQASAAEERSQYRNRRLAMARLRRKLDERNASLQGAVKGERWRAHQELERGNPIRVFRAGAGELS
jgi:peptide chain release factor